MNKAVEASASVKLQEVHDCLKTDHEAFQISISSKITKLQEELAMERKISDSLAIKIEKIKVLDVKLKASEKKGLHDHNYREKTSCCEIHDSLRYASQEGECSEVRIYSETSGEGVSRKDEPKALAKPIVKKESEPKGKEKVFVEEPIVDNCDEEELDEDELKRRKDHEAELDEHQRIIREAKEKQKAENEA
ncbi:unnamed protein product [Lactuca saligna]|uniref:Uncharacterized protein n=1 Tax=Lactuca saligna TaxID=75948 RepID=A0AA35YTW3_LACSI|nr:unnamed protein product [Lactuca saligna]